MSNRKGGISSNESIVSAGGAEEHIVTKAPFSND